jgi:DNA processing protein
MKPIPTLQREDPRFPQHLRNILEPPELLYYRAESDDALASLFARPMIAIVGTRRMTAYGKSVIRQIVPALVRAGCVIVSGLALGCDGEAHRACLEAHGGTIAVLGSGIDDDSIYPRNHFRLAEEILAHGGAVISEYPAGTPSYPGNFPIRNRIIAGLCAATIVIEAEIKSGSLITAKFALEFGREVFAVPGPIHAPYSSGTNYLIQHGAHLLTSPWDVLERLGIEERNHEKTAPPSSPLLKFLSEPRDFDALIAGTKLAPSELMTQLTMLEIDGLILREGACWMKR